MLVCDYIVEQIDGDYARGLGERKLQNSYELVPKFSGISRS